MGYEGRYEVSDRGRVRSLLRFRGSSSTIMKMPPNRKGYHEVNLTSPGSKQRVHLVAHLVLRSFQGERPDGLVIRHLNGNPTDNRLENLQYGTPLENTKDQFDHGRNWQKNKTECPQGHPYTEENTRIVPSRPNARYCRACERARGKGSKPSSIRGSKKEHAA